MSNLNSVSIMGDGTISAGNFEKIKIMGSAEVVGQVKCNFFKVMGSCDVKENISMEDGKISGDVTVDKNIEVSNELKILGNLTCKGNGKVKKTVVLGEGNINGNLLSEEVIVKGELNVDGDCECTKVDSKGSINVKGLLTADEIDIDSLDTCYITEIGGSRVTIQKSSRTIFRPRHGKVISKVIEADEIVLEDTKCDVVRGKDINILKGCTIGRVEYSGTLKVDKNSKVLEEVCQKN